MQKFPLAALTALTLLASIATLTSPADKAEAAPPAQDGDMQTLPDRPDKGYQKISAMECGQSPEAMAAYLAAKRKMRPAAEGDTAASAENPAGGWMLVFANDDAEWAIAIGIEGKGACIASVGTGLRRPEPMAAPKKEPPSATESNP